MVRVSLRPTPIRALLGKVTSTFDTALINLAKFLVYLVVIGKNTGFAALEDGSRCLHPVCPRDLCTSSPALPISSFPVHTYSLTFRRQIRILSKKAVK